MIPICLRSLGLMVQLPSLGSSHAHFAYTHCRANGNLTWQQDIITFNGQICPMRDVSRVGFVDQLVSKLLTMDNGFKLDGFTLRTIYRYIYIYMRVYIYNIYIGSRLGVPRSFQEPSVLSLEMGGGGV